MYLVEANLRRFLPISRRFVLQVYFGSLGGRLRSDQWFPRA
jgi:hypothetical protein